jgi:hypothetical protein
MTLLHKIVAFVIGLFTASTPLLGGTFAFPANGGTGTSTVPSYGKVLVGTAAGVYQLQATSTLGITAAAAGSAGQVQYNSGGGLAAVSTTSISTSAGLTSTGTLGSQVGGTAVTLKQIENRSFTYATSTAWTGTTTIPLGVGYGEVWNSIKCFTNVGTLNVDFYHASTHFNFFNASTTIGTVGQTGTDTSGDTVKVDIGTPATAPTSISCTVNDTI